MSRTGAPRALRLVLAAAGLLSPTGAWAGGPPVVAVFGIQSDVPTLKAKELDGFTDYLTTRMAEGGRYKVVPKTELRRALQQKKAESYNACYAESCQIEIGNELAAQQTLASRLQRFGETCVLTLTLYDLRQATSAAAATAEGGCGSGDIFKMLKTAASKLAGSASAPAPGAATIDPPSGTDYSAILADAERAEKDAAAKREVLEKAQRARAEHLETAWGAVSKYAEQSSRPHADRAKQLERFVTDFEGDNPHADTAKAMIATLRAGKEPGAAATGMVRVPAGEFFMGCNGNVDTECGSDEKPGRTVSVRAFRIDKTEVTVAEYARCVRARGCRADGLTSEPTCNWEKSGREQHPINCLDWSQADALCRWARKRLPTEAEWEKAARGTDGRTYAWGNETLGGPKVANIADAQAKQKYRYSWALENYDDGWADTAPVGAFPAGASPYGALDMVGNVWEWTADWYLEGKTRMVRGGSWSSIPRVARASYRRGYAPTDRSEFVGVRCAQSE